MHRAPAALLVLASAHACHDVTDLPPPIAVMPARSALLLFVRDSQIVEVFAGDPGPSSWPSFTFSGGTGLELYALFYGCSLDALGLTPGWQELAVAPADGLPLPSPREALRAELERSDPARWEAVDSLPPHFRSLRFPRALRADNCARFGVRLLALPNTLSLAGTFAIALGPREALVGTSTGTFFRVSPESAVQITNVSTRTPHLAAFREDDGTIWLFGGNGRVARGDLERGFSRVETTSSARGRSELHVDGSHGGEPRELFLVTDQTSFDRYHDGAWTSLINLRIGLFDSPGVVRLGPDEALVIGLARSKVNHYRAGTLTEERLVPPADRAVTTAIAIVPSLGPVVGTFAGLGGGTGRYFVRKEGGWQQLPGTVGNLGARVIVPFRRGFLAGIGDGVFVEYDPESGFCEPQETTPNGTRRLLRMDGELMAVSMSEGHLMEGQPVTASFITPLLPDAECSGRSWWEEQ
ncbi:MAG: hypothetical protein IT384_11320 [Deltaproteobacteria bacterium]|nr:hypothetical protein [Deltaproteobacteria bacterium]